MSNPMSLEGKRILVTGASSGIGAACAQVAAELGASVILVARRTDRLEMVRAGLVEPVRHQVFSCDLTDRAAIGLMVDTVTEARKLDGVIYAAGVGPMMPVGLLTEEHVQSVFDTNYFAFLELVKRCTKFKARNAGFSVVAVSSASALAGWGGGVVYCGSKGALSSSVRALAMELASKGIRVNAVCPSNIKTPMYENGANDMNDEESLKRLLSKQPLGLGSPRQVANAVAFLLSDASSFITGVNLPVDGGYLAH